MKFTMLEQAWLEELGVFEIIPTLARAEQKSWKSRAGAAATRVQNHFRELQRNGEMREIAQAFKLHRANEKKPMSWNLFALHEQVKIIGKMAREQVNRAGRGLEVE